MRSILVACARPTDDDPAVAFAAELAARTGAASYRAALDGAAPEAILAQGRESGADLLVVAPRLAPGSGALGRDPAAARIALADGPAVLLLRLPVAPIRRILVPVRREDLRRGTVAPALEWAGRLRGAAGAEGELVDVQVLHLALSPDELHADVGSLREQLARLATPEAGGAGVRMFQCVRWGARPQARVARWAERHRVDLVVLPRPSAGSDAGWLRDAWGLGGSVLLLPREGFGESEPEPALAAGGAVMG